MGSARSESCYCEKEEPVLFCFTIMYYKLILISTEHVACLSIQNLKNVRGLTHSSNDL